MVPNRNESPILVIHPDRRLPKTVHRIVGGTFRHVIIADDFESAAVQLGDVQPFIAIVDHQVDFPTRYFSFLFDAKGT